MSPGKLSTQVGHAYLESYIAAGASRQRSYRAGGLGTKICLTVPDLRRLLELEARIAQAGLPHALIEDTGRNTSFNGVPTISALGVGPLMGEECAILKRLPLCL